MINQFSCLAVGGNTGVGDCPLILSKIAGMFIVRSSFALSAANLASDAALLVALRAAAIADLPVNRLYPVHEFVDIADNSSDPQQQTFGYGPIVNTDDGIYDFLFTYIKGGICLSNQLRKFNGQDVAVIFYDSNNVLFGWRQGDTLKGIPLIQFWANKWRPNTGAATLNTGVNVKFNPIYMNEQLGFYKVTDFALSSIAGLQNATIAQAGVQAAPSFKFKVFSGCNQSDLYDLYSAELAAAGMWSFTNGETGAAITITSVVVDANIKGWTVLLAVADPDYVSAITIKGTLAAPSVLDTGGVKGIEGLVLTFNKA